MKSSFRLFKYLLKNGIFYDSFANTIEIYAKITIQSIVMIGGSTMKFSQMEYQRPNVDEMIEQYKQITERFPNCKKCQRANEMYFGT